MKGFIASIITLSLLVGTVIWNGIWIRTTTSELLNIIDEIPSDPSDGNTLTKCNELSDKWNRCNKILCLTVSHTEVESINSGIITLAILAEKGEAADYAVALSALEEAVEYLRLSESLSFDGIF